MVDRQIEYWAHMLDESRYASYYEMYMKEHPEDKLPTLINALIKEFAADLRKDGIKLQKCLSKGKVNVVYLDDLQKKLKTTYKWELIPAKQYAAIISRMVALLHRSKGQRFNEDDGYEIEFDDVAHFVPKREVEKCLDIVCHNTNVLEANNCIVNSLDTLKSAKNHEQMPIGISDVVDAAFEKNGIPKLLRNDSWTQSEVEDYYAALQLYKKWGSYGEGRAGEEYICDSDNGPAPLKKVLSSVEYSADVVDLAVTLNKALDIVHFRSDLAAAFVEGGQHTCAMVSNLPSKFVI